MLSAKYKKIFKKYDLMLSTEYKDLFENNYLIAHIAESLADFAEHEIKEDSLLNVLHRSMDALCDGEYLASIMEYFEYTPEEDQIKAVDRVCDLFELAYKIVENMDAVKVDKLTEMVRNNIMPFACLLDVIFRNKNVIDFKCEQNHKIMQK